MDAQAMFFRPGGTLEPGAKCYIVRKADEQLLSTLLARQYVFLLDSRQKGKSSLIARSIVMLREAGVRPVKLDLQRIGANVSPEQWYAGLAVGVGQELGLQAEVIRYWEGHQAIGPLARFIGALQDVVLPHCEDPIVIFVDEVDFVRALTFPTDEFFAAIRECFNRRSSDDAFKRLTFCLVGVATPGQLIRNPDISPFNIGVRIDLTDFTLEETSRYAVTLGGDGRNGKKLMERIQHWVGGHPYLTQVLCNRVVASPQVVECADVDRLVKEMFLSPEARQREPNLSDVERRILDPDVPGLAPEERKTQVLELYGRMLKSKGVEANEQNPVVATLRLSGIGHESNGALHIRNALYRLVFNESWRVSNLPEAEVRRQASASRRATLRTAAIASVVVLAVASAAGGFFKVSKDRESALAALGQRTDELRLKNYVGLMASIRIAMFENRWINVSELIDQSSGDSLRGWEWGHVAKIVNGHVAEAQVQPMRSEFERDPDGSLSLLTMDSIYTVTPSGLRLRRKFTGPAVLPQFRRDNLRLGVDVATGRLVLRHVDTDEVFMRSDFMVYWFNPKTRTIVVSRADRGLEKRDFNGKTLQLFRPNPNLAKIIWLSNDDELRVFRDGVLVRADSKGSLLAKTTIQPPPRFGEQHLVRSRDERLFTHIDSGQPRPVQVRRTSDLSLVVTLDAPPVAGGARTFAPDNRSLLVSDRGQIVRYDLKTGKKLQDYPGHKAEIMRLAFLPDGRHFASVDRTGVLRVWPLERGPAVQKLASFADPPWDLMRCDDQDVLLYATINDAFESRNLRTGSMIRLAPPAGGRMQEPSTVVSGTKVFVGTSSGSVERYSADGLVKEKSVQVFKTFVHGMTVLMDGKRLLVRSNVGKPHPGEQIPPHTTAEYAILDTESLAILHRFSPAWPLPGVNYKPAFTSDGPIFGLAANRWYSGHLMPSTSVARLVSAETGQILRRMEFPNEVDAAALTSDGARLIVALYNGLVAVSSRIEVYDTATGLRTGSLDSPGSVVRQFERRGDLLLASLADDTIAIWHVSKGPECLLISPGQKITFWDISPDRDRIVTVLADGSAMIWDAKTGEDLYTLRVDAPDAARSLQNRIEQAIFSKDGTKLFTYGGGVLRSFSSIPWKDQPKASAKKGR